jgi:hypothetical protein
MNVVLARVSSTMILPHVIYHELANLPDGAPGTWHSASS